jgi:hypothetical protein
MFFLDASEDIHGVSLVIKSILKNNRAIYRLLMNKIKLNCPQAGTIPRKELAAAHLTGRVKDVVCNFLRDFLSGVEYSIEVLSDSQIVLNQIRSLPWLFKPWVSAKLAEIRETLPTDGAEKLVVFKHVTTAHNVSDRQTRLCYEEPQNIPWLNNSLCIDESQHTIPLVTKEVFDCPDQYSEEDKGNTAATCHSAKPSFSSAAITVERTRSKEAPPILSHS